MFKTERNSYETHNIYPNLGVSLSNQQQFGLNKINEIKGYLVAEIKERVLMNTRLSKYIASIGSFATVIGAPAGMVSASFILAFSISAGIIKELLKTIRNKKKKQNKIVILARSKLNSIESKITEALINNEISHENFMAIINEEKKYQELKKPLE